MFLNWLTSTSELKHWGCNALTISFLVTICFDVLMGWSLVKQFRTIGRLRTGESVSALYFANMSGVFLVFLTYGILTDSLGATLNGALGVFAVAILYRLKSYRPYSKMEKLLICAVPVAVTFMIVTSHRELFATTIFVGALLPSLHQAQVMYRNRSAGAVEPCFLLVFMASSIFWTIYAFAIGDAVLRITCPIGLSIQFVTIALWLAYRGRPIAGTPIMGSFSFFLLYSRLINIRYATQDRYCHARDRFSCSGRCGVRLFRRDKASWTDAPASSSGAGLLYDGSEAVPRWIVRRSPRPEMRIRALSIGTAKFPYLWTE
jgi:uncharacterized protein with PQ loop repeat